MTLTGNIVAVLNSPISELDFSIRIQHTLAKTDIDTLRDLLFVTHKKGFETLCAFDRIGRIAQMEIKCRLHELNILDDQDNCDLYKYLEK